MEISIKKYLPYFVAFIVLFLGESLGYSEYLPKDKWYLLIFFAFVFTVNETILTLGFQNKNENFIKFFMLTVIVRLVLSVMFLVFFLFFKDVNTTLFVGCFFVLYLFFSLFEILNIYSKLRRFSDKEII